MDETKHILAVDDEERNLKLIDVILKNKGYSCENAKSGEEAINLLAQRPFDLVLLDIMMPHMDGYEVCRRIRENPATRKLPVVLVTSLSDRIAKIRGLEAGANDFLSKPVDSTELLLRCQNLMKVKEYEDFLENHNLRLAEEVRKKTREVKESYRDTILRLTNVSEFKDEETTAHIRRVGIYCREMAKRLGWGDEEVELIELASLMHDIGKVGIPSEILLKRGRLTDVEFALMRTHAEIGAKILSGSSSNLIQMSERIAAYHHERWDDSGYPGGLRGEKIPIEARIMNLADQYDALRSVRPYKPGFSHEKAHKILTEGDGRTIPGHFDPVLLDIFKENHQLFESIYDETER